MAIELFANNVSTTISSGGTSAPASGTVQTWTVASSTGFPTASNSASPPTIFRIVDVLAPSEVIKVTNVSGSTWTVTRGSEGTPVAHTAGFRVKQVVTAASLKLLQGISSAINVKTAFGAAGDELTDDTTAIQNAIDEANAAGGGTVYLPTGIYLISSALVLKNGVTLLGDGATASVIFQATAGAHCLTGIDLTAIKVSSIGLQGPNSGTTGCGMFFTNVTYANQYMDFSDLEISLFGGDGVSIHAPSIVSLTNVVSFENSGRGFFLYGTDNDLAGQSVTMTSCYTFFNNLQGYHFRKLAGCTFNAIEADSCTQGYLIEGCVGLAFNGCNASFIQAGHSLDGSGFLVQTSDAGDQCYGITFTSCWAFGTYDTAWNIVNGNNVTLITCNELDPEAGAVSAVTVASGCTATLLNCDSTTPISLAAGTTTILNDGAGNVTVPGNLVVTNTARRGTLTLTGATDVVVSTTTVTSDSIILLTIQAPAGTPGAPLVSARTAGTSFSVKSSAGDTSTVGWFIIEPV